VSFDLIKFLRRHRRFSNHVFGLSERTAGIVCHLKKEIVEAEACPDDLKEWCDIIILAADAAMRRGFTPEQIAQALADKLEENMRRVWPNWRDCSPNDAIEHRREPAERLLHVLTVAKTLR
jgi:hypothetical protein